MQFMSDDISKLAPALVAAQAAVEGAAKDHANSHLGSHYADLKSIWTACKPALSANGLSVVQLPMPDEDAAGEAHGDGWHLRTVLLHESGQWISSRLPIRPKDATNPQQVGSWITYARRYALAAMVGVCPEDDDGEGAMQRAGNGQAPRRQDPPRRPEPARRPEATRRPEPAPQAAPAAPEPSRSFRQLVSDGMAFYKIDPSNTRDILSEVLADAVHQRITRDPGGLQSGEQMVEILEGAMMHHHKWVKECLGLHLKRIAAELGSA